ncbi:MAG: DEAD/DEAH box helicase [Gammaproteobacteria bacterium]
MVKRTVARRLPERNPEPTLTAATIRATVGFATYARGSDYFAEGRVEELVAEAFPYGWELQAVTRGSGRAIYSQDIVIDLDPDGVSIEGDCTCPVGYNCKHVAAVCLAFLTNPETRHTSTEAASAAFTRWLEAVASAGQIRSPGDERVVYLLGLSEDADFDGRSTVECRARIVKSKQRGSGYTRGRHLDLLDILRPYNVARAVSPADAEIATLLLAGVDYWQRATIAGRAGGHALDALLESGRCYWMDTVNEPLRAGNERTLGLSWRPDEDGDELLLAVDVGGGGLVLPTDPPRYLDAEQGLIGPLACNGLNHAQLALLADAPPVPAAEAEALSRTLLSRFQTTALPPPAAVATRDNSGQAARPILGIHGSGNTHAAWLSLDFAYGDDRIHALPAGTHSLQQSSEGLVRISRDPAAEAAAQARLTELGFEPCDGAALGEPATRATYLRRAGNAVEWASAWSKFLHESVPTLAAEGWSVEQHSDFDLRFESADWTADISEDAAGNDWFALGFGLEVDGRKLPLLDLLAPILDADWSRLPDTVSVPIGPRRYVDVPAERLRPLLDTLRALFAGGVRQDGDGRLRLGRADAALLNEFEHQGIAIQGASRWRELAQRLADFKGIQSVEPDPGLAATLRPYQRRGLDWLQFLREYGFNGVLADDMGLGKTLQTLAHLLCEKRAGRLTHPALVVAPTSLMGNWAREAARFAPALAVVVLHGQTRHARFAAAADADLVLTTYPLLSRDAARLAECEFHSLILDEAQNVKNPRAKAAQVIRQLRAKHRLCLTGTPLENHLGELWALFDFLMPGFLGDSETFRRVYRTPIENQGDTARQGVLARRVAPFMLRRSKQEVAADLPPKTEILEPIAFEPAQAELYESIRAAVDKRVREAIARQGLARSHITILDALLKLRQVCCDPRLLHLEDSARPPPSAKLARLLELLEELLDEGRRVLLFSQFTSMLSLVEAELERRGIAYAKLTGQTRKRDAAIDRFRSGEVALFLISLKAGGVGLNLPEADTVIHYDPWWNPAAEAQATDRAHRIGQTQPVFVYKLIVENSVEEKMITLQDKKRALAAGVYAGQEGQQLPALDADTLAALLAPIEVEDGIDQRSKGGRKARP